MSAPDPILLNRPSIEALQPPGNTKVFGCAMSAFGKKRISPSGVLLVLHR
jgi:hypothetical protein